MSGSDDELPEEPDADDGTDDESAPSGAGPQSTDGVHFMADPAETDLVVGGVQLAGVYDITATGGGYTGKYVAQRIAESPHASPQGGEETDGREPEVYVTDDGTLVDSEGTPLETGPEDRPLHPVTGNPLVVEESDDGVPTIETTDGADVTVAPYEPDTGDDDESDESDDTDESDDDEESDDATGGPGTIVSADIKPPALELTVRAWCTETTWQALADLRTQREPFDVEVGGFVVEDMGLTDLSRHLSGGRTGASDVTLSLKEHRVRVVHSQPNRGPTGTTPSGGGTGIDGLPPGGPTTDWVGADPSFTPPAGAINVVDEGADNTGSTPINSVVSGLHGSDQVLYFPPGEYLLNQISLSGSNWQWVGNGATLLVPQSVSSSYLNFGGSNWEFRNFVLGIQGSWPNSAAPRLELSGSSDFRLQNILVDGMIGHPDLYPGGQFLNGGTSGGTGVIDNVLMPDGTAPANNSSNRMFSWCGNNSGHLIIRRCLMVRIAQSIIYAEAASGPVTIENCIIQDSNSGLRIGGGDTVRNCRFDQTGPVPAQRWSGGRNARGLRISGNGPTQGEATIIGCDFDQTGPDGSVAIEASNPASGGVRVEDTRVRGGGIRVGPNTLTGSNVHVTEAGVSASGGSLTDSCVTGSVSGVSGVSSSSGCDLPNLSGAFGTSSAGDVGSPDADEATTGEDPTRT